jgi:hypothetical protein
MRYAAGAFNSEEADVSKELSLPLLADPTVGATDCPKTAWQSLLPVPDLPSVPVQSIILATQEEPGMFDFYRNRPSFLTVHRYADQEQLLADLDDKVIRPAELKVRELRG